MSSPVYFTTLRSRNHHDNTVSKIARLFKAAGMDAILEADDLCAIKLHFGEAGGDGFIKPPFVRSVVDQVRAAGAKPFLTDTNTLYSGSRHNAVDHMETAISHGFAPSVVNAPVIIADGLRGENAEEVAIGCKHIERAVIAGAITHAQSMVVLSHFKGHELAGFGGAIKNLAMGCAPSAGKKDQHAVRFTVKEDDCIGCGTCMAVCPQGAATVEDEKASIDTELCIGCGECLAQCEDKAISIDWKTDIPPFMERMTEYALASVHNKRQKTGYLNFLINITPDCDCVPWSDRPIVADIGILASLDPVAIDTASLDLVNRARGREDSHLKENHGEDEDKFKGVWNYTQGEIQLHYGEEIGLGSMDYELIQLDKPQSLDDVVW